MRTAARSLLASLDGEPARARRAAVRRRRGPAVAGVPAAQPSRRVHRRAQRDRQEGRAPAAGHRAERARVRAGNGHHRAGGSARPEGAVAAGPAQRRLLGERVRRPGRRSAVVVAVRGASPVGDDDRGRARRSPPPRCSSAPTRPASATPAARSPGRSARRKTWSGRCSTRWARRAVRPPWWRASLRPTSAPGPAPGPASTSSRSACPPPGSGRPRGPCWPSWSRSTWTGCPRSSRPGEAARLDGSDLHFAWEGPLTPGARHYYRVQGDDLLIEYDTTADGNHAHTVLRRPRGDFGDDVLAAHYARAHP